MSSLWSDRQGQVGDLGNKSRAELLEILSRQEKLLKNKRFIQTLPDKGKRISDFVKRVHHAISVLDEAEKMQTSLSSVSDEFQVKYQQAFVQRRHDSSRTGLKEDKESEEGVRVDSTDLVCSGGCDDGQQGSESHIIKTTEISEAALMTPDQVKNTDLVEALERVTLSEKQTVTHRDTAINSPLNNPFYGTQSQTKPHYIEVLEKSDANVRKPKFKLNQLPEPSASPSPPVSPLNAEARRQRDRKHIDDITAATLPPLYHAPAQLLSLNESLSLIQEQTRAYQECQAKLAAQKLAEGLSVRIGSYKPEGGTVGSYREVRDEGALSSEED